MADRGDGTERVGVYARWKDRTTGGASLYPLAVLFGLNTVDELDRTGFGVLLPEIRDHFGLDLEGILTVVSLSLIFGFLLAVPIGFFADRFRRVPIAVVGAALWAVFSVVTGMAVNLWILGIARTGTGLGRAVNDPVHNSLLADYYDVHVRARVYGLHRYANALGQFLGAALAGVIAYSFGWRVPFFLFGGATVVFLVLASRLREPIRGHYERRAAGASEAGIVTEEEPPSWAESWRILFQVQTLRRIFVALPFLAVGIVGLIIFTGLFYEEVFSLDERQRGLLAAFIEGPAQLAGLLIGIPLATRLMARGANRVLHFLAVVALAVGIAWVGLAVAPNLAVAVVANSLVACGLFMLIPGTFAVLSLAIPAKVRSFGYAVATLFILPGLLLLPMVGAIGDTHGIRFGLLAAAPVFVVGGFILASAGNLVVHDIERVWKTAAARSEVAHQRQQGEVKLLLARGIDVHYDGVQVLFGVDLEVDQGEVVALLGTNGAGKSTLLRAMSGVVQPSGGAVIFDGRDITHSPPNEVAARGISQVPGGQGVFTHLTVGENLRLAGWLPRPGGGDRASRRRDLASAIERVLDTFPMLRGRWDEPAGNLSGGQQQMLTLGMAFVGKPRLLMIDELSLGLAPVVVTQLLEMVRMLRDQGTTIILVEQSANVALTVAERAYFMEKGEIRFQGPTKELLERPDLLRSVFLNRGSASLGDVASVGVVEGGAVEGDDQSRTMAPPTTLPVLEVREVVCRFGGVRALDGVSFDVEQGEVLGFIGPNGAGKTTLFDVLCGFTPSAAGTVRLRTNGVPVDLHGMSTPGRAWRGLGRSFQDGRLFPGLTVSETVAVALEQQVDVRDPVAASLHLPAVADSEQAIADRVEELIELLGLEAYRDKFTRELSTGTRRIVDLACVLAQEPQVVLLDEPSSGIAQREAEALGPVLLRVRRELSASLMVIEHDLPLLLGISDRIIALDLGRVVADGEPHDVISHPEVIASYLGTEASEALT